MTLLSCYYPDFQISSSFAIPKHLQDLLHKVWQRHYEELYEEDGKGTISLEETFEEVLDALHNQEDILDISRKPDACGHRLSMDLRQMALPA